MIILLLLIIVIRILFDYVYIIQNNIIKNGEENPNSEYKQR